jgi:hypothetical protein
MGYIARHVKEMPSNSRNAMMYGCGCQAWQADNAPYAGLMPFIFKKRGSNAFDDRVQQQQQKQQQIMAATS